MAARRKRTKKVETEPIEEVITPVAPVEEEKKIEKVATPKKKNTSSVKKTEVEIPTTPIEAKKPTVVGPKYKIGSIVYVSKEAGVDLNGFKLFPQYKKYAYTVEAYDANRGVYSIRRLNLLLKLKEADLVAPDKRAHDSINRKQF